MGFRPFIVAGLLTLLAGCAATGQARKVQPSGFLGADAEKLTPRGGVQTEEMWLLNYNNPDAQWASYDKFLLDPVTLWVEPGKELGIPLEDAQRVADNFYRLLHQSLSKDYEMVSSPQPGALRASIALSQVSDAQTTMNVVTTVVPQLALTTTLVGYASGKPAFTGEVALEGKMTDAMTGELLGASVDKRVGQKKLSDAFDSWAAVDQALEYWSELLRFRMCTLRGASGCVEPEVERGL